MTTNNNKNNLETENFKEESEDDWVINDSDNVDKNDIFVETPSFIRLFVIRRIIDKYIKNNKNKKKKTKEQIIKEMAKEFKDDRKIQSLVINIVTRLINDGIKKYMNEYYNEKKEAYTIEDIFNKIILKNFEEEYNEIIKYGINNNKSNDNYYQNLLFNSSDLINQIFQYLEWGYNFDDDLYSCSLVSSHWLYHVWNPNSVYHADLYKLVKHGVDNNRKCTRLWQRLYNVKSIEIQFDLDLEDDKAALPTANKLSMFRKVEKVNVTVVEADANKCISVVIPIMSRCKHRIKDCRIHIGPNDFDLEDFKVPSPLRLPKAQYVEIGDLLFYRQWTNECTQLRLQWFDDISKDWCKFVIENCDCSNITTLILHRVMFDDNSINEMILKQLAMKFYNLKTLQIEMALNVDDNVLLFWQLLKPILSKNKTKVQLAVAELLHEDASILSKKMDEKDLKIDKLTIGSMFRNDDAVDGTIKLIQERDNGGLNHLAIEGAISDSQRTKLFDELKCKSITTFELEGYKIKFVNPLLDWKKIVQKQIFVIIDVHGYGSDHNNSDEALSLFKQLYENVYQLFVQQIALDIKITFKNVKDSKEFSSYLSIYSSYFENSEFLSKYNKPNCNSNICLPRDKPYTYFYVNDSKKTQWQRYFVFSATNVQMKYN